MALYNGIAEVEREGKAVIVGEKALDGSNPTPIVTPFAEIKAVVLTIRGSSAPADDIAMLTYAVSGKTVNVYAWEHNGTDPTLVASDSTATFSYLIVGVLPK